jgi:hypothetical protein
VPLLSNMEFVRLKAHHLLHETGDTLKSAYFCNTGMVSILSVFSGRQERGSRSGRERGICRPASHRRLPHSPQSGGGSLKPPHSA